MTSQPISADFPFESRYINVYGSRMHYIDEGEGDPILFLHGNPTSSYLWRNIIPYVTPHARAIAVDLIGMGKSDKPDLTYRFDDHARYLDQFIEQLGLQNVTLVIHDWGSALGFNYAYRHQDNVRGIAFMEAMIRPLEWDDLPKEFQRVFKLMRTPGIGWGMISVANMFLKQMLPQSIVRDLTPAEQAYYEAPFKTIASRKPVRQWPSEIPFAGSPADNYQTISAYSQWLTETDLPMLLFYGSPGGLIREPQIAWLQEEVANLDMVDIGDGLHFIQEDNPHLIGAEIARWYTGTITGQASKSAEEAASVA